MGKVANNIYLYASRYKYLIVIALGVLIVCFLDENSLLRKIEYEFEISDLQAQIDDYNQQYEHDQKILRNIKRNPKLIENIARERYLMKTDDEDIFILSTDITTKKENQNEENETPTVIKK